MPVWLEVILLLVGHALVAAGIHWLPVPGWVKASLYGVLIVLAIFLVATKLGVGHA